MSDHKSKNPHTPDFKKANAGDKVFTAARGNGEITAKMIQGDKHLVVIRQNNVGLLTYYKSGKQSTMELHPSLFNSFEQFMAYWQWEAKNKEVKDDTKNLPRV